MSLPWRRIAGWYHAALVAGLPWLAAAHPAWAMLVVAAVVPVHRLAVQDRSDEPWRSLLVATSAFAAIAHQVDAVAMLVALLLGLSTAVGGSLRAGTDGRPDGWDAVAVAASAGIVLYRPTGAGGVLAVAGVVCIAALAIRRVLTAVVDPHRRTVDAPPPSPPDREVRGTLGLSGVLCDGDGLPRTTPLDLEIRAGRSVAVVCDHPGDVDALLATLAGRRAPREGVVTVDALPLTEGDRLVAVVAPGERFLPGSIETNLGALTAGGGISRDQMATLRESFGLGEVEAALDGRSLAPDGEPLSFHHRMLLLAARVVPSSHRVLVVVDPRPWVNAVCTEVWRNAVVRASVGRTSIWITEDPELLRSADDVWMLRHGALRPGQIPGAGGE